MNTIQEIGLQNQQDFWAMLYLHMGRSIMEVCGRRGERILRLALRRMAIARGEEIKQAQMAAGIKTNLKTLYAEGNECCMDPRVRGKVLCQKEDMRIWEVYTCPLATLWLDQRAEKLGNYYCEETQLGLIKGYTDEMGQLNLSKKLITHRTNGCRADNHCRFSAYYRAANLDEEQRERSFVFGDEVQASSQESDISPATDLHAMLRKQSIDTVCFLIQAAKEEFGNEGLCGVALGLRALAVRVIDLLRHNSDATLSCDMETFAAENLPISLDAQDPEWGEEDRQEALAIFQKNFLEPLKEAIGISRKQEKFPV